MILGSLGATMMLYTGAPGGPTLAYADSGVAPTTKPARRPTRLRYAEDRDRTARIFSVQLIIPPSLAAWRALALEVLEPPCESRLCETQSQSRRPQMRETGRGANRYQKRVRSERPRRSRSPRYSLDRLCLPHPPWQPAPAVLIPRQERGSHWRLALRRSSRSSPHGVKANRGRSNGS